jgi:hypothetical protein
MWSVSDRRALGRAIRTALKMAVTIDSALKSAARQVDTDHDSAARQVLKEYARKLNAYLSSGELEKAQHPLRRPPALESLVYSLGRLQGCTRKLLKQVEDVENFERPLCAHDYETFRTGMAQSAEMLRQATESLSNNPQEWRVVVSALVQLEGDGRPVIVLGKQKPKLLATQYKVVEALVAAGETGLTKDQLVKESGCGDARGILRRLADSDPDWAAVIQFAGGTGRRYRIARPPS